MFPEISPEHADFQIGPDFGELGQDWSATFFLYTRLDDPKMAIVEVNVVVNVVMKTFHLASVIALS